MHVVLELDPSYIIWIMLWRGNYTVAVDPATSLCSMQLPTESYVVITMVVLIFSISISNV